MEPGVTSDLLGRQRRKDGSVFEAMGEGLVLQTGEAVRDRLMGVRDPKTGLRWISFNTQPVFAS